MMLRDRVEFYDTDGAGVASVDSSHSPLVGDIVSIRQESWRIVARSWALDYSDNPHAKTMVCACRVERA